MSWFTKENAHIPRLSCIIILLYYINDQSENSASLLPPRHSNKDNMAALIEMRHVANGEEMYAVLLYLKVLSSFLGVSEHALNLQSLSLPRGLFT